MRLFLSCHVKLVCILGRGQRPSCGGDGLLQMRFCFCSAAALPCCTGSRLALLRHELCGQPSYMWFMHMQAFLSLCQGNHYQFDTIRRAKHSSAMVLYHLHNPDAPAFASTCNRWAMASAAASRSCTEPSPSSEDQTCHAGQW